MRQFFCYLSVLATLCFASCQSTFAGELSKAEIKARDYAYKGATFGMRLEDFERKFSVGLPMEIDPSKNSVTHQLQTSRHRQFRFVFKSNQITEISAFISLQDVNRLGGTKAIEKKLVSTFGRPRVILEGAMNWDFPKVSRRVIYVKTDSLVVIHVEELATKQGGEAQDNEVTDAGLDLGF